MRVLLDAKVLISYLLAHNPHATVVQLVHAAAVGYYQLLIIDELLTEVAQSVQIKPYLRERITAVELFNLISLLGAIGVSVPPIEDPLPAITRDPKDDYLLAYAVVGAARYLVTGDYDFLELGGVGEMKIVTPRDFLAILQVDQAHRQS